MADDLRTGVPSTMAINGHPIHPMLVPFPVGFLVGALATDLAFWGIGDPFWSRASLWLLAAGFVMGALAAVIGLIDFLTIERARTGSTGWVHFIGNAIAGAGGGECVSADRRPCRRAARRHRPVIHRRRHPAGDG